MPRRPHTSHPSSTVRGFDWYDLPELYDVVYDGDTQLEANFLEAVAERHGVAFSKILEPACGGGRLLHEFARRGLDCYGYDLSSPSVRYCKDRLRGEQLKARVVVAEMAAHAPPGGFDFAHCLLSSFKYLLNEAAARAHLRHVTASLRVGGLYVIGMHLSDVENPQPSRERWSGERDGRRVEVELRASAMQPRQRRERMSVRISVEEHNHRQHYDSHWVWRTYDDIQLRRLLASVPELTLDAVYDFSLDLRSEHSLEDEQLDTILVLRRIQ